MQKIRCKKFDANCEQRFRVLGEFNEKLQRYRDVGKKIGKNKSTFL